MKFEGLPKLYPAIPDAAAEQSTSLATSAPADAPAAASAAASFASAVSSALDGASDALRRADVSERAFAAGHGELQRMVVERAQADVALSIASAAASRTTQAISAILAMQV
jgi:flagellar hook-basal body complex protein FliE